MEDPTGAMSSLHTTTRADVPASRSEPEEPRRKRSRAARLALAAALLVAVLPACARGPREADLAGVERTLSWGGVERHYRLYVPAGAPPEAGRALLLAFHGGGGNARIFEAQSGLDAVAEREGFVVAYPAGSGRFSHRLLTWNAGEGCCGYAERSDVDDVGFALAVVEDVARCTAIDRTRVYATGHSNGAMMTYRLAHDASEHLAAIAAVGGASRQSGAGAGRPVPVLHIHSVDDPRALYTGGLGPPFPLTRTRVNHFPVEAQLATWRTRDGCPDRPVELERRAAPSGHTAVHLRWSPCDSGAEVELWRLTGAGHGWPGGASNLPEGVVGPDTNVIDAAEEVWRFVSRFRRPD